MFQHCLSMLRHEGGIKGAHVSDCGEHIRAALSLNFSLMAALGGGNAFPPSLAQSPLDFFSLPVASCHIQGGLPVRCAAHIPAAKRLWSFNLKEDLKHFIACTAAIAHIAMNAIVFMNVCLLWGGS